jgi:hypothetical protein
MLLMGIEAYGSRNRVLCKYLMKGQEIAVKQILGCEGTL